MVERQNLRFCTTSDGVRIAYATTGHGPPLVKVANWLSHLEEDHRSIIWRHWIRELSRRHTFVRYDERACGLSDREVEEVSLEAWVRDLEAVVDAMGLERFPLLALSAGGPIAVAYAVRHPERVSHIVFCGAYVRGRMRRGPADVQEALVYHKLAELGWGKDNAAFRQVFAAQFVPGGTLEQIRAFDDAQRFSTSAKEAVRYMQAANMTDVSELCARVSCPCLVIHAKGDVRIPFDEGRRLASLIPGARFVPLEGRNHVILEDEPAWPRFLAELDAFLPAGGRGGAFAELTPREREIVALLARGLDNHQIAAHAGLSEKTVRNHVSAIFSKLAVESRAQAIVRAREAGFGGEGA